MNVIFDFDYTLLAEESTVEVLNIALESHSDRRTLQARLKVIAPRALAGKTTWRELLYLYWMATRIRQVHIQHYIERRRRALHPSLQELIAQLKKDHVNIFIISGGYEEWIKPLASGWGIDTKNVIANRFCWCRNRVIGIHRSPLLSSSRGKPTIVDKWKKEGRLQGPTVLVGDGHADRAVWQRGLVEGFIATEYYANENLVGGQRLLYASRVEQLLEQIHYLLSVPKTIGHREDSHSS